MTDVSNLDDLAAAISNKSPNIRKYAVAQAAATQSQESDLTKLREDVDMLLRSVSPPPPGGVDPGPGGVIAYVHDYTAARGQSTPPDFGWSWGFQGYNSSLVQIVSSGYSASLPSLSMTSPEGYTGNHEGLWRFPPTGGITTELGTRVFYGFNLKFATGWPTDIGNWGATLCQLSYAALANSGWSLWMEPTGRALYCLLLSGYHQPGGTVREYNNHFTGAQGPPPKVHTETAFPLNTWMQFIFDILWSPVSSSSSGYQHAPIATVPHGHTFVYYRHKGDTTWTQTVNLPDVPTLQWGYGNGQGNVNYLSIDGIADVTNQPWPESHKWGWYGGQAAGRTLEHANICWGNTFDVVAGQLST